MLDFDFDDATTVISRERGLFSAVVFDEDVEPEIKEGVTPRSLALRAGISISGESHGIIPTC